jgi:RHS repeat-associated protein
LNFTGMNQDTASNVYDFPAREYGIQGRWPSPDPAGLAAVNPMDPQTWNRYAYVRNSPLELTDPLGLCDKNALCSDTWQQAGCPPGSSYQTIVAGNFVASGCFPPGAGDAFQLSIQQGIAQWQQCASGGCGSGSGSSTSTGPTAPQSQGCSLSTGQRVSLGIQGGLNAGIGGYKAVKGFLATLTGLGFGPETGGISLIAAAGGGYLATTGGAQTVIGVSQLQRAYTENGGPETTTEQWATVFSGPAFGFSALASTGDMAYAERMANFESAFSGGVGLINSSTVSEVIGGAVDEGLTLLGIAGTGGCAQQ